MSLMEYTIEAIIGVIILLIFVPMIFHSAKNIMTLIAEKMGLTKFSPLEKAILCTYYRCVSGCNSIEVQYYCNDEQYMQACSLPMSMNLVGDSGRICGELSSQFPVVVKTDRSYKIEKWKLSTRMKDLKNIFKDASAEDSIRLPGSAIIDEKQDKKGGLSSASLKQGTYYIFMTEQNRKIFVETRPRYINLTIPGASVEKTMNTDYKGSYGYDEDPVKYGGMYRIELPGDVWFVKVLEIPSPVEVSFQLTNESGILQEVKIHKGNKKCWRISQENFCISVKNIDQDEEYTQGGGYLPGKVTVKFSLEK